MGNKVFGKIFRKSSGGGGSGGIRAVLRSKFRPAATGTKSVVQKFRSGTGGGGFARGLRQSASLLAPKKTNTLG